MLRLVALLAIVSGAACGSSSGDLPGDAARLDAAASDGGPPDARACAADGGADDPMRCVTAGSFTMGCLAVDPDCRFDEVPSRRVWLSTFDIDRREVTQGAYADCVAAGACQPPVAHYHPAEQPDEPVRSLHWADGVAYCAFRGLRLPTEAEWEAAARGRDERIYPWGDAPADCNLASFEGCMAPLLGGLHPAGAGPYGAEDQAGGVWEMTADYYAPSYQDQPVIDPQGPTTGQTRVARGGSFRTQAFALRTTARAAVVPTSTYDDVGIRCARTPP
jgi:iron(II)-dependent oxidoreductase